MVATAPGYKVWAWVAVWSSTLRSLLLVSGAEHWKADPPECNDRLGLVGQKARDGLLL